MKGKILLLSNGTILILVYVGCMAFLTRSYGVIPVPKVLDAPPSRTHTHSISFQLIAHFLMLMVLVLG